MIIVIEGAQGVGKSTLADGLSKALGIPVYRPFRSESGDHAPGDVLRKAGFPTNTWVEDMYTADVLAGIGASAILDRSMPSGLAYAPLNGFGIRHTMAEAGWAHWLVCMRSRAVIIHLVRTVPESERQPSPLEDEAKEIANWVDQAASQGLIVLSINVDALTIDQVKGTVADHLGKLQAQGA